MKIMVTGATGFIGKKLIKKLNDRNHEIVVLTRNPESARFHIPIHCDIETWDLGQGSLSTDALREVDAVINLAGENIASGRWTDKRKRNILQSRVASVKSLIKTMELMDEKPRVLVSASAIGFYGDHGDEVIDEAISKGSGFLSDVCKSWEDELFKAKDFGTRIVAFRIGMVLGHDGGALKKILPPFKLGLGGRLGSGSQWMSWIHIDDLVNMLIHAIENPSLDGIYNAVAPHPVKNNEFTTVLGRVLNRPTIFPVPRFVLKLGLGELSELLLSSQRAIPRKIHSTGFSFRYSQLEEALKEICGHSYHEIRLEQWVPQSIEKTFSFFKEAKNLEKITPEFLKFKVLKQSTQTIQEGTKISYRFSLHGFPVTWQSQITDWKPSRKFSDIQVRGPYNHWHHTHEFDEKNGGTLVRDQVTYKVPFGVLGDIIIDPFIRKDLEKIFSHRRKVIQSIMC
jgi:hypothetical protein